MPVWTLLRLIKVNNCCDLGFSGLSAAGNPQPHVPNICLKSQVLRELPVLVAGDEPSVEGKASQGSSHWGIHIARTGGFWVSFIFPGDKIRMDNYSQAKYLWVQMGIVYIFQLIFSDSSAISHICIDWKKNFQSLHPRFGEESSSGGVWARNCQII